LLECRFRGELCCNCPFQCKEPPERCSKSPKKVFDVIEMEVSLQAAFLLLFYFYGIRRITSFSVIAAVCSTRLFFHYQFFRSNFGLGFWSTRLVVVNIVLEGNAMEKGVGFGAFPFQFHDCNEYRMCGLIHSFKKRCIRLLQESFLEWREVYKP